VKPIDLADRGGGFSPSERRLFDGYSELHGPEGAELEKGPPGFYRVFQGSSAVSTPAVDLLFSAARASRKLLKTDISMHPTKSRVSALFGIDSGYGFTWEIVAAIILPRKQAREQSRC
jgi:hypothetical protein